MCAFGQPPSRCAVFGIAPAGALSMLAMALAMSAAACQAYRLSLLLLVLGAALSSAPGHAPSRRTRRLAGFRDGLYRPAQHRHHLAAGPGAGRVCDDGLGPGPGGCGRYGRLSRRAARIGGPKLAPRISPNKTWAGLLGGIAARHGRGRGRRALAGRRPRSGRWCWRALCSASSSRRAICWNRASSAISASRTAAISFPAMAASSTGSTGFWP